MANKIAIARLVKPKESKESKESTRLVESKESKESKASQVHGFEWLEQQANVCNAIKGDPTSVMPPSFKIHHYHFEWLLRLHLICQLHDAGLHVSIEGFSIWKFGAFCPDEEHWVRFFGQRKLSSNILNIFGRLAYGDGPEYFSMWCCILLTDSVLSLGADWVREHAPRLKLLRKNTSRR